MLNLNKSLIRNLIKELIYEYYQSKLPTKWEVDLKFNNKVNSKSDLQPPSSKPPSTKSFQQNTIEQKFENWWVSTNQNFKIFNNWSEIYKEYIKSNEPPRDSKQIEKLKTLMLKKLSYENRINNK